jgi:uncharacterized protein YjiS (DUF1127 family)
LPGGAAHPGGMKETVNVLSRQTGLKQAGRAWLAEVLDGCLRHFETWQERSRTRRAFAELDARGLADIGLSESQRHRECAKWFWQR